MTLSSPTHYGFEYKFRYASQVILEMEMCVSQIITLFQE